jgi:energy-coupling factor transport system permease protein
MRDIRLRTGTAMLLSITAFFSVPGAAAALLWWLIFTPNISLVRNNRLVIPSLILVGFFSIVLAATGGEGLSYFFRMVIVILIASWLLAGQARGEFLDLGCWMLGPRWGFELGLLAEMALQNLETLLADFDRIRAAERLKGIRSGMRSLVPAGRILLHGTLMRAGDTAALLAVRRHHHGGTWVPELKQGQMDIPAALFALCAAFISLLPVSALFILY